MEGDADYTRDELSHGLKQAEEAADAMMAVYESAELYDAEQARAWTDRISSVRETLEEGSGVSYEARQELVEAITGLQEYTRAEMERERDYLQRDDEPSFDDVADVQDAEEALEKLDTAAYVVSHLVSDAMAEPLDSEEEKRTAENMGEEGTGAEP